MKTLLGVILSFFITTVALAQQGTVTGTVSEPLNGRSEAMPFANVAVMDENGGIVAGSTTDMMGVYMFKLNTGTYSIEASFAGYQTKKSTVTIEAGKTASLNFTLEERAIKLVDVEIEVTVANDNEKAIDVAKQKATNILDGISKATMELTGDGTAVEAAQRVTGVSIEGGKYVYVRGLGDRYSKTTLNGMDISGLDPDRNSLQMDIFPTSLISNMMVSKTFTAEQPADFTGGIMNVETKDLPEYKIMNISLSLGFNPNMHLNSDYLRYQGGKLDFLGMDDGTRALPDAAQTASIPTPVDPAYTDENVTNFVSGFNSTLGAERATSFLDASASFTYGNQKDLSTDENKLTKNPRLGYIFSVSYKSDYNYYSDVEFSEYQRVPNAPDSMELRVANQQTGEMGERNFLLGGLAGIAYKTKKSKIRMTMMRLQSGSSTAGKFSIFNNANAIGQSGYNAFSNNLEYTERALTNLLINGQHKWKDKKMKLDWRVAPTITVSDNPDIRKSTFTYGNDTTFSAGDGGMPSRIWRELDEMSIPVKVDITKDYEFRGNESKLLFGASHTYKKRDYRIMQYNGMVNFNQDWNGEDLSQVLTPENIFPNGNAFYYQSGNSQPNSNEYSSALNNTGVYVSTELGISTRLQGVFGVRAERFVQTHTGRDQQFASGNMDGRNLVDEEVLNSLDFFPSLNLIYRTNEKQNLRASFSKTIARPSFKELSFAQIIDPLTNRIFNGALIEYPGTWGGELVETRIDNYDFRYEYFGEAGQTFSASVFYKAFDKPIELVRIPEQQTSTEYQPRNVGDGSLYGIEVEFKKNLGFMSPKLEKMKANANVTLVQSQIEMSDQEYTQRKAYERTGETITRERTMAGQSPFVINGGLTYKLDSAQMNFGIFYNVKGPTLFIVGGGLFPDVYSDPFHSLGFSVNKKFGKEGRTSIDLKASNILNDNKYFYYSSFQAENQVFSLMNPGMSFSLGFKHKF